MAGKKAQRIAELEGHLDRWRDTYLAVCKRNEELRLRIARLEAERKPSLADAAKREWQQFTDRLLDGLGL